MNKITKCLLLTTALFVGFTVKANAVSAATLVKEKSNYYYDRMHADGSDHHSWYFQHYTMDGEISYCIEPNVPEGVHYNQQTPPAGGAVPPPACVSAAAGWKFG